MAVSAAAMGSTHLPGLRGSTVPDPRVSTDIVAALVSTGIVVAVCPASMAVPAGMGLVGAASTVVDLVVGAASTVVDLVAVVSTAVGGSMVAGDIAKPELHDAAVS